MLSGLSVASCAAGRTAECAPAPPVGLPVCEISRGVCMRPDVRDFMRMGTSFLLAMCKNSHAARILEINSTNVRFSSRTPCPASMPVSRFRLSQHSMHPMAGCVVCPSVARRPAVAVPPRKKNLPAIAGRSGIKAFGGLRVVIDGKLVYPLEIVDSQIVARASTEIIPVNAGCARDDQIRFLLYPGLFILSL